MRNRHHEDFKSNQVRDNGVIDIPQGSYKEAAPTDATDEIGSDDDIDESDDDKTIVYNKSPFKKSNLFDDEDDNDNLEEQNAPGKGTGVEEIAGIDKHDTTATDKDKSDYVPAKGIESEAANNKDDDNPEQQRVAQQETGGEIIVGIDSSDTTATGNDKSDYKSAEAIKSDAADNKKRSADKELGGKKQKKRRKKNRNN
jgi:hypothetical protein